MTKQSSATPPTLPPIESWGPKKYGIPLTVDRLEVFQNNAVLSVDVEDDEQGGLVGIGVFDGDQVGYFTQVTPELIDLLDRSFLVGHNFKTDLHKLRSWGVKLNLDRVIFDTRLASYTIDSSKQKHGLKDLAKEHLDMEWPRYTEIVGSGKGKKTLDKQPLELVAAYNAMDCIATYMLYWEFLAKMNDQLRSYYFSIELPAMKVLYEMERRGVKLDVPHFKALEKEIGFTCHLKKKTLMEAAKEEFNPNSPKQVLAVLRRQGVKVRGTDKKKDLSKVRSHPFVQKLLEYKELHKLLSTYLNPLLQMAEKNQEQRIYTTFNQTLITGRLSSTEPNLQNIPAHTELGKSIRAGFIAKEGHVLICADYSQIDLRALAHCSGEPAWVWAFTNNEDPHAATAIAITNATGVPISRQTGKTLNFTMAYGSGAKNVAYEAKCSLGEAQKLVNGFWSGLPQFRRWKQEVITRATQIGGVRTLFGRFIPIPKINSLDPYERGEAERACIAYIGQGTPAEIVKKAMIKLHRRGITPLLQEHDSLIFEVPEDEAKARAIAIQYEMENATQLIVPLKVSVGIGNSWMESKS